MSDKLPIEIWDIDKLVPYAKNAKKHADEQVKKLATSIKEFGWTQPIVLDLDGVIIAGHGRRLAAISLGLKKVPVIVRRDLSKEQADALRLADNRVTSVDYDMGLIQEELQRLDELDFDLGVIGFDDKELSFGTADLGEMTDDFFVEDVGKAVEEQQANNAKAAAAADDSSAPIVDALGFKRVTTAESRRLRELVGQLQKKTGAWNVGVLCDALAAAVDK